MAYNDWNIHGDRDNWERYADYKAHYAQKNQPDNQRDKEKNGKRTSHSNIFPLIIALCFLVGMIILYVTLSVKY